MNIADRIQHLRKAKGISQEELADKIGVSRQAVSKWESEQSSPDMEKIILMSDFFEVTTDYLLKGIEPLPTENTFQKPKPPASIFTIIGTAFHLMGIIVAALIWYEKQTNSATAAGLIFLVLGCMIYGIGMTVADAATKDKAKQAFWSINIWVLPFIPLSMLYNILTNQKGVAPYPLLAGSSAIYLLFWIGYLIIGVTANLVISKTRKNLQARKL